MTVLMLALVACAIRVPVKEDMPLPDEAKGVVDFSPLLRASASSNSVYAPSIPKAQFKRMLVGPNIMFESSRSSSEEPKTYGPGGEHPDAPHLEDALGTEVTAEMSAALLEHLLQHGVEVYAPIGTMSWCGGDECPQGTWVERAYVAAGPPRDDKTVRRFGAGGPTSALAVRALGLGWETVPVAIQRDAGGSGYVVRLRTHDGLVTACPEVKELPIPRFRFQAEVVELGTGRFLARINETRPPDLKGIKFLQFATLHGWEPTHGEAYAKYRRSGTPVGAKYKYISGWKADISICEAILRQYSALAVEMEERLIDHSGVRELLAPGLEPLMP